MTTLNNFLFIALPYIAIVLFVVGAIYRYRRTGFKYSSLSSQFLEGNVGFWGAVPFHYGLIIVLTGHLVGFFFPGALIAWNSDPIRLIILEVLALVFGLGALVGLVIMMWRRLIFDRLHAVTNKMDVVIEILVLAQIVLGVWTAVAYRWGSTWFATDLTPYLWSILTLTPNADAVIAMPVVVKLHIVGAFLITLLIPFSRLVHFLVAPFHYMWRPYQQVIWNWNRRRIRKPTTVWSEHRPKNN